jgi:hypothetical protein
MIHDAWSTQHKIHLCNLAGTEQELPEDDTLVLKHVVGINTAQYDKLSIRCAFVCLYVCSLHVEY